MKKPTLIILAAGLGSRFGGDKQTTAVDEQGHFIIDYSIYDAWKAGFGRVVFVIKPENEGVMRKKIGDRVSRYIKVDYAPQRMEDIPEGFVVPDGRVKPWGTLHALLAARDMVSTPFAVINADDFYGREAFAQMYAFLTQNVAPHNHAMIGYPVENTLTENGSVSRGVCKTDGEGRLTEIVERTRIFKAPGGAKYVEGDKETFIPAGTLVSMNFWGFSPEVMDKAWAYFPLFLKENLSKNPNCEYYLPLIADVLIHAGEAVVDVLPTCERWYGVTYQQDLAGVEDAIAHMRAQGKYPNDLWDEA